MGKPLVKRFVGNRYVAIGTVAKCSFDPFLCVLDTVDLVLITVCTQRRQREYRYQKCVEEE